MLQGAWGLKSLELFPLFDFDNESDPSLWDMIGSEGSAEDDSEWFPMIDFDLEDNDRSTSSMINFSLKQPTEPSESPKEITLKKEWTEVATLLEPFIGNDQERKIVACADESKSDSSSKRPRSQPTCFPQPEDWEQNSVHSCLHFHELVSKNLVVTSRGRDFKKLNKLAATQLEKLPKGCKDMKNKVKGMYGERRRRVQINSWKHLVKMVGVKYTEGRVLDNDKLSVFKKKDQVLKVVREWFPSSLFEEEFCEELSEYLVHRLALGYDGPGTIIRMETKLLDIMIKKLVEIHLNPLTNNGSSSFASAIQYFQYLFAPAEVEIAILFGCKCESCVKGWELEGVRRYDFEPLSRVDRDNIVESFRAHYTVQKAKHYHELLTYHMLYRSSDSPNFREIPKCKDWCALDIQAAVKATHNSANCEVCANAKKARRVRGSSSKPPQCFTRMEEYYDSIDLDSFCDFMQQEALHLDPVGVPCFSDLE